jgi:hypothetical protein
MNRGFCKEILTRFEYDKLSIRIPTYCVRNERNFQENEKQQKVIRMNHPQQLKKYQRENEQAH